MGQELKIEDYSKANKNFWWNYLLLIRGYDDKRELNFDEVVVTNVNPKKIVPNFGKWYQEFYPDKVDEDGEYESPNYITLNLSDDHVFVIEFQPEETNYYLNDRYLGNMGGEFEAWFLTWKEIQLFEQFECGFLLALPMLALLPSERKIAQTIIENQLKTLQMFDGKETYLAKCLVNGLIIKGKFEEVGGIGLTNTMDHSVRNIKKYPRYKEDVVAMNQTLTNLLK